MALVLGAGCAASSGAAAHGPAPATPSTSPASAAPPGPALPALPARAWGNVTSLRFSLVVELPDRNAWQVDDRTSHWLLLRHVPSHSELRIRTWRAGLRVRPSDCERRARLWRPEIPKPRSDTALDRRRLSSPKGYVTRTVAGVQPLGHTGTLEGFVLAFGATVGRCFAFVYTTRARGTGAEGAIGDRLGVVTGGVLKSVRMRTIDDRVDERQ